MAGRVMTRRRRRARGHLTVLPCLLGGGWLLLGDPAGWHGEAAAVLAGLLLAPFGPLLAVTALQAAGGLVPRRWRAWEHRRHEDRPHVPAWLRRAVYAADGHRCCYCGGGAYLQLDHVRPWSLGGRTTLRNMVTLCGPHNRAKSNYWRDRDGYVHYRPFDGQGRPDLAASILAREMRVRRSPARIVRAALALALALAA